MDRFYQYHDAVIKGNSMLMQGKHLEYSSTFEQKWLTFGSTIIAYTKKWRPLAYS